MPALLAFSGAVERDPAIYQWLDALPGELAMIARKWFTQMQE